MESFFLSETTKYMYLLFDVDNEIIHKPKEHVVKTPFGECVVESGGWIFNTEAHPIGTYAHAGRYNRPENLKKSRQKKSREIK